LYFSNGIEWEIDFSEAAIETDDLDAEISRLKAKGVPVCLEIMNTPICRFAIVCDPDANEVMFHKRKET
jgi:predicted enzyme related to lactoylglutathione lyase